jgi:hypothetical protein
MVLGSYPFTATTRPSLSFILWYLTIDQRHSESQWISEAWTHSIILFPPVYTKTFSRLVFMCLFLRLVPRTTFESGVLFAQYKMRVIVRANLSSHCIFYSIKVKKKGSWKSLIQTERLRCFSISCSQQQWLVIVTAIMHVRSKTFYV